jgi:hypothetical protein
VIMTEGPRLEKEQGGASCLLAADVCYFLPLRVRSTSFTFPPRPANECFILHPRFIHQYHVILLDCVS